MDARGDEGWICVGKKLTTWYNIADCGIEVSRDEKWAEGLYGEPEKSSNLKESHAFLDNADTVSW